MEPFFAVNYKKFIVGIIKIMSGNIINMSSIYGAIAPRFAIYTGTNMTMPVEYAAVKSAIIHLTRYFHPCFQ